VCKLTSVIIICHPPTVDKIDIKDSFYKELEYVSNTFPKCHMKILLDLNAKVGMEDIFKPTTGNESLHKIKWSWKCKLCHIQKSDSQKYNVHTP
jgi:hypothetical protein